MATCTDWPSRDWYVPPVTTCTDWQSKEWTEAAGGLGHAMGFDSQSASELSGVSCEESPSSDLQARSDAATERCLRRRIDAGDKRAVLFLAQLYFDRGDYESARPLFASIAAENVFAQYQLGVMLFEGLGFEQDLERGFRLMLMVALSVPKTAEQKEAIHRAQYNIARAYFMGYGVHSSEDDGRRWLDRAVDGGSRLGSARAQTMLAMLLARSDTRDLPKSFFWHSEATGNGSLESQGALGVMYLYGLGVRRDLVAARFCLSQAARRGNIYATAQLALLYYRHHFYRHAARFSAHLAQYGAADVDQLARQSGCLARYVRRGLAIGCYLLSRCLLRGQGCLAVDEVAARRLGARAVELDPAATAWVEQLTMHGSWLRSPGL
ncbi:LRP2-binding protein-like isoform X2 [Amphibalanus amphitrite]|uniref:LRP2-binding protein-like isoform X2 n=1 Tax=Amphibalanus amphitrite TaxID=1232801 RepID=UPI001C9255D7|nr:LRP2-binding protein-like isoform X2 [Amphibalanus amphitrite]